mmetsp:Transcript_7970/g.12083  ORF Transcript_7970/g.12083 Transcript_7970/m.12083 type:complete len:578 (+) Transcript_7970:171-1904(+)|eukprot:CAMPEP_0171457842 /NCGR_PEP_ID=MMETSP0945-20130129/3754_1 /TAXON_ID=109269 /ORGANISM="Vaucheria litorea, Strain CCMP2940" /LENGTH=577 /DNA_ID=CAMNT_0011983521 /DNA_START=556 /DNA_END=2289 /DNA_ORIENTATION=+
MDSKKVELNRPGTHSNREKGTHNTIYPRLRGAAPGRLFSTSFLAPPVKHLELDQAKLLVNCAYYSDHYKGKLVVRIDDSGEPEKLSAKYETSILQDLEVLGITPDDVSHSSDYFIRCEQLAEKLIIIGRAYMDIAPELSAKCRPSSFLSCIRRSPAESLQLFKLLCLGHPEGRKYVLRARIGLNRFSHEQTLYFGNQDPIIYSHGNSVPHYRMDNDFSAYPSREFARPIVDAYEGISHIILTSEDEDDFYSWVQRSLQFYPTSISTFGKVEIVDNSNASQHNPDSPGTVGSSFLLENLNHQPTLKELMRRGMSMVPLRAHLLSLGVSKKVTFVKWDSLWGANRKFLEPLAPRFMAVRTKGCVRMSVKRSPKGSSSLVVPMHPRNDALGTRTLHIGNTVLLDGQDAESIEEGEEVTLLRWTSVLVTCIHRDLSRGTTQSLESEYLPVFKFLKKKKAVTWLADCQDLIPLTLVQFSAHPTIKTPKEDVPFFCGEGSFNPLPYPSCRSPRAVHVEALGDPSLCLLKENDLIQLERLGFFRVDVPFVSIDEPMVLFMIPDGKNKSKNSSISSVSCQAAIDC